MKDKITNILKKVDWSFLQSNRFWIMIGSAITTYLYLKGIIGYEETILINMISGGYITVRTIDRHGEQKNN